MISTYRNNIYVLNNNLLLIYDVDLNLTRMQKVMAVFTPILHRNYVAAYKTLYKISNGELAAVRTFKKKIASIQTDDEHIVISESTGNILIARRGEHHFRLLLGHYLQINKMIVHDGAIITADNYKIRVSEYDGRIRNIFFASNHNVFYGGGFFYVLYDSNLQIYERNTNTDTKKDENEYDALVLLNTLTLQDKIIDILLLNDAIYLITDGSNYLVKNSGFTISEPSPYNFKDAFIDDDSVYFYTEESKLQKLNVKDLK
ncbi:hypothetical protein VCUG_01096 [Vavraia culicis subsp. floridensis]|uniref:Uncharacterized protein n=1 Tax=Vavraia culicis (isolate floridensis) TaxID=948595 RepID=L2GWI5_VAVCU|nr:uncharacterized protein VCUG_01096 [Vavraia culicis subsp. floridensis]ELA47445.1 hypothetical protein VCUG_01096 [Vavraia culicis subsp. floridensis]